MNQSVINYALTLSLKVRTALLESDPDRPAQFARPCDDGGGVRSYPVHRAGGFERTCVALDGAVFIPCNPLAIVRHAARSKWPGGYTVAGFTAVDMVGEPSDYSAKIGPETDSMWMEQDSTDSDHMAAIKMLVEVLQ